MTILYTDIRGYTHIQEGLDPRHGIGFLNDYLRRMEPAIVTHGGFVDSYVGDGMVALFAPASDGALKAALAMRRIEREVGEERRWCGLDPVRTGIVVHTGNVGDRHVRRREPVAVWCRRRRRQSCQSHRGVDA